MDLAGQRTLVTGATGLIGRNLVARLESLGSDVVGVGSEHDLRDAAAARTLLAKVRPTVVYHLAARVGGIYANVTQKPGFYRDNVLINTHTVDASIDAGVEYFFAMGTGCAYPKRLEQETLHEEDFLDGVPEVTNDAYAYAKRGMLVHLEALREESVLESCYCIPANIYGPHDNFHPKHSHVVPALVRRFVEATDDGLPRVEVWGGGGAKRDFLYVGDCIDAMLAIADARFAGPINVGTGELTTIRELAEAIRAEAGFSGEITYDRSMPEGQAERHLALDKIRGLGWTPRTSLRDGLAKTIDWFRVNRAAVRER
jgi:GDP-L-fucose synthase